MLEATLIHGNLFWAANVLYHTPLFLYGDHPIPPPLPYARFMSLVRAVVQGRLHQPYISPTVGELSISDLCCLCSPHTPPGWRTGKEFCPSGFLCLISLPFSFILLKLYLHGCSGEARQSKSLNHAKTKGRALCKCRSIWPMGAAYQ